MQFARIRAIQKMYKMRKSAVGSELREAGDLTD
jgi:hypothetical protein